MVLCSVHWTSDQVVRVRDLIMARVHCCFGDDTFFSKFHSIPSGVNEPLQV